MPSCGSISIITSRSSENKFFPELQNLVINVLACFFLLAFTLQSGAQAQSRSLSDSARSLLATGEAAKAISLLEPAVKEHRDSVLFHRILAQAYLTTHDSERSVKTYLRAAEADQCDSCHQDLDSAAAIVERRFGLEKAKDILEKASDRHSDLARSRLRAHYLNRGNDELTGYALASALSEFTTGLQYGEDTLLYDRVLLCYDLQRKDEPLVKLALALLDKYENFEAPRFFLANAYARQTEDHLVHKRPRNALESLGKIMLYYPKYCYAQYLFGTCFQQMNDTIKALLSYKSASECTNSAFVLFKISQYYTSLRAYTISLDLLLRAVRLDPYESVMWLQLAVVYGNLEQDSFSIGCTKIAANLGNVSSQEFLRERKIPYDDFDYPLFEKVTGILSNVSVGESDPYSDPEAPTEFVPFEKEPVPISSPRLVYPEFAKRIGAEGTVWVKLWVKEDGSVRKALVTKSDNSLFNVTAVLLAYQYKFSPAIAGGKPVAVWVTIPFRFKLNR